MTVELPAITPVQRHSPPVIGAIYGLFRNLEIHDEHNQLFERLTTHVVEVLVDFESETGEPFTLQMYGQELVVCTRLLRLDDDGFERAGRLGELLVRAGIGGLRMSGATSSDDLARFCHDLRTSLKGGGSTLVRGTYGEILFGSLEEDPSTALEARPEQLALWLFATLLGLTCDLTEARAQRQHPSLLPLKRVLQRVSGAAAKHGAVFQLVPSIRDYAKQLSVPHRAVCEALTVLGFGIRLGLTRSELLSISLAAILCRIVPRDSDVVSDLLEYRGLGDLGPTVVLAAHDALHPSDDAGLPGQLLSLVRTYEDSLAPGPDAVAPAEAVARLLASPPPGVEGKLAELFAAWLGREPLGSPLELEDGQLALVFGPSAHAAGRSRVGTLEPSGVVGPDLDLGAPGAPAVREHPSPARLELDLTRLRAGS